MINTWKRKALALLSVPLLAIPSAVGVYTFLLPTSGAPAAGLAAAGFELLYIGVNILVVVSAELRRYARNVSLCAVATAVLMNTLAHYTAPTFDLAALGISVVASLPLATLAYAVSVLLHRLSEADVQHAAEDVRLRAEVAQRDTQIARMEADLTQARADSEEARTEAASLRGSLARLRADTEDVAGTVAQLQATIAQREQQLARLRDEAAQLPQSGDLDTTAIARALREPRQVDWRTIEGLLGVAQATLRGRVERTNGHLAGSE